MTEFTETVDWWQTPPPWRCEGCEAEFSDLGHVDLSAVDGYDADQSTCLCPSCWPRVAGWAEKDRLISESSATVDHDRGAITFRHPTGQTITESFHGPTQEVRIAIDQLEDAANAGCADDEGGDDDEPPAR